MFNEFSQESEDQGSLRGVRGLSVWAVLLSLAWLVYELTVDPALAAVVACGKVGWNDLRTAWWLYQRDPVPRRGGVYLVLYIASALWRIAVASTIVTIVAVIIVAILEGMRHKAVDDLLPVFAKAGLEMSVAYVLCALATAVAVGLAWHQGLRLWLDPAFHRSRRENRWPPEFYTRNRANRLLVTTLVIMVLGTATALAVFLQDRLPRAAPMPGQPASDMRAMLVILCECIGIFLGWITWRAVYQGVLASDYDECWVLPNEGTDSQLY